MENWYRKNRQEKSRRRPIKRKDRGRIGKRKGRRSMAREMSQEE